jgi:hypothetical protein
MLGLTPIQSNNDQMLGLTPIMTPITSLQDSTRALLTAALLTALSFVPAATAQLSISVDPAAKTMALSGSVSGTPGFRPTPFGPRFLFTNTFSGTVLAQGQLDLTSHFSTSPGSLSAVELFINDNSGTDLIQLSIDFSFADNAQTITAVGTSIPYGALAPDVQTAFEGLAASSTVLNVTNGTSSDTVQLTAVPEPSSWAILAAITLLALATHRRFNRTQKKGSVLPY